MKKILIIVATTALFSTAAYADNAWGPYHWARTTASFDLTVINSTTSDWDGYVANATYDWSESLVLNMVDTDGSDSKKVRRRCKAPSGKLRICNLAYGQNGWLGIAGISIDANGHIVTGYTKLNDTYFSWEYYDNHAWKQSVTCQELGHNAGLDHQDVNFNNASLLSCMDYQDPPWEEPNKHDYYQLEAIYGRADSYNSYAAGGGGGGDGDDGGSCNAPKGKGCNKGGVGKGNNRDLGWGASLGRRGAHETFIRIDPDGTRHLTHVTWAVGPENR